MAQCGTLALHAGTKQYLRHTGGHTGTDGGYIGTDELHGIINTQSGIYTSAGTVDIHLYITGPVRTFQEQQLRGYYIGHIIIDALTQENDPVHHQPAENIHAGYVQRPFLYNIWCEVGKPILPVIVQGSAADASVLYCILFKFITQVHIFYQFFALKISDLTICVILRANTVQR
jgi:hypothetical protein